MNKSIMIRLPIIIALFSVFQTAQAQQDDRIRLQDKNTEWNPVVQSGENEPTTWYPISSLERTGQPHLDELPVGQPIVTKASHPTKNIVTIIPQDDDLLEKVNPLQRPMDQLSADIREFADVSPADNSSNLVDNGVERWSSFNPPAVAVAWAAPNIRYQPLYFEDVRLERYGQTRGPVKEIGDSAFHFFASAALFPYHAYYDRPQSCDYPLGFCRPGICTQPVRQLHWWGW